LRVISALALRRDLLSASAVGLRRDRPLWSRLRFRQRVGSVLHGGV